MKFRDLKFELANARYGLQACRNLLQTFIATGDLESQAYFIQRERFWMREISKLEATA